MLKEKKSQSDPSCNKSSLKQHTLTLCDVMSLAVCLFLWGNRMFEQFKHDSPFLLYKERLLCQYRLIFSTSILISGSEKKKYHAIQLTGHPVSIHTALSFKKKYFRKEEVRLNNSTYECNSLMSEQEMDCVAPSPDLLLQLVLPTSRN